MRRALFYLFCFASPLFAEVRPLNVYFAGALFSIQEIAGNELFATAIEEVSDHRYKIVMPQRGLIKYEDPLQIRNADLNELLSADVALFNFNGEELDSGTVVEYIFAKFADMPTLVLRTDDRDIGSNCETWNIMAKYYPRNVTLIVPALETYLKNQKNMEATSRAIATQVVASLDQALKTDSLLPQKDKKCVQEWIDRLIDKTARNLNSP